MKKFNLYMIFQWIIFLPLILPLGIVSGAIEGVKNTFQQAVTDIAEQEVIS